MIRLAQSHLNLLEICPPQFQRLYLEELNYPITPEEEEKQTWGSQFHLLMQQKELGLPINSIVEKDEELQKSLTALVAALSEMENETEIIIKDAEHCRTLNLQGYLLTVIYDLLIIEKEKAQIFDWKTYLKPQSKVKLERNWQTRLYLYILAETAEYLPEQISMTYWFVRLPNKPQSVTFTYNNSLHQQTHQDLSSLLTKLDGWLEDYLNEGIAFPHKPNCEESCPYYNGKYEPEKHWLTIEDIEEVAL